MLRATVDSVRRVDMSEAFDTLGLLLVSRLITQYLLRHLNKRDVDPSEEELAAISYFADFITDARLWPLDSEVESKRVKQLASGAFIPGPALLPQVADSFDSSQFIDGIRGVIGVLHKALTKEKPLDASDLETALSFFGRIATSTVRDERGVPSLERVK